jgi:1-deoxy-D-xylulose-5-phosphate synthase
VINATVWDMRFVKPLDTEVLAASTSAALIVTVEEHQRQGGAGSAVGEWFADHGYSVPLLALALPDRFEAHGKHEAMLARVGLDAAGIRGAIEERLKQRIPAD